MEVSMRVEFKHMKQALDIGCYLSANNSRFRIYWPQGDVELLGNSAPDLLSRMQEIQRKTFEPIPTSHPIDTDTRIHGIPIDGAIAYKEGVPAADCPYMEEDPDFARW